MKKQYITPTVEVTLIKKNLMLEMSIDPNATSSTMGAKRYNIIDWDEDDYED